MTQDVDIQLNAEAAKRIGELELERTVTTRSVMQEEHSAAFRWLMASLLALNGAGLLALKDTDQLNQYWGIAAVACFYTGISAALLIAWFGQRAVQASSGPLSELITFWTMVAVSGEFKQSLHSEIIDRVRLSSLVGARARYAGIVSFLAFSLGLLAAVIAK